MLVKTSLGLSRNKKIENVVFFENATNLEKI